MANARCEARLIVIAEDIVRPRAVRQQALVLADDVGDGVCLPLCLDQVEVERQVCAVQVRTCGVFTLPVVAHQFRQGKIDFADQNAASHCAVAIQQSAHFTHDLVCFRLIGGALGKQAGDVMLTVVEVRISRVVAEFSVLDQKPEDVHAEAVHAPVEPKTHSRVNRFAHLRITPVEVRLLLQEGVAIELLRRLVERPCGAAKVRLPVVRHSRSGGTPIVARLRRIVPEIPVAFRMSARGPRFDKPGMLVRTVVGHEIKDQLQAAYMSLGDEVVEVGERAKERIDAYVIRNIVTEIGHRRGVKGGDPDRIDAESDKVIQALFDTAEVTDTIAVRILKAAWVHLINDARLPPLLLPGHADRMRQVQPELQTMHPDEPRRSIERWWML